MHTQSRCHNEWPHEYQGGSFHVDFMTETISRWWLPLTVWQQTNQAHFGSTVGSCDALFIAIKKEIKSSVSQTDGGFGSIKALINLCVNIAPHSNWH